MQESAAARHAGAGNWKNSSKIDAIPNLIELEKFLPCFKIDGLTVPYNNNDRLILHTHAHGEQTFYSINYVIWLH